MTGVTIDDGGSCYHDGVILPDKVVVITCQFYTNWSICVFAGFFVLSQTKKTQSEIQWEYRKRKKEKEGDAYLEKKEDVPGNIILPQRNLIPKKRRREGPKLEKE